MLRLLKTEGTFIIVCKGFLEEKLSMLNKLNVYYKVEKLVTHRHDNRIDFIESEIQKVKIDIVQDSEFV